jgi:hypothetical protein
VPVVRLRSRQKTRHEAVAHHGDVLEQRQSLVCCSLGKLGRLQRAGDQLGAALGRDVVSEVPPGSIPAYGVFLRNGTATNA